MAQNSGSDEDLWQFSHTGLGVHSGSYLIRGRSVDTFMNRYSECLKDGVRLHLTERHKAMSPILIDLDFRQDTSIRLYNETLIKEFLNVLLSVTKRYINQDHMVVFVLEKPNPRSCKGEFKDGLHIMIEDVVTIPSIQHQIRKDILNEFPSSVRPSGVTNPLNDIYDEAVIDRNNWFMYGSMKPDEKDPWRVTHMYIIDEDISKESTCSVHSHT
jgi:hypothetical protein